MPKIGKVVGPPGTGKTTYLMGLVREASKKFIPQKIGAISFTNTAVEEIKNRVAGETNMPADQYSNIKTVHSHAWHLLGLSKDELAETHIKDFNEKNERYAMPEKMKAKADDQDQEDPINQRTLQRNAAIFAKIQLHRQRQTPLNEWTDIERSLWAAYDGWMQDTGLTDFTGMLEKCLEYDLRPDIDMLFCDEWQDASALQNALVRRWGQGCEHVMYVGDSDQAIFRWAGAEPEVFRDLPHTWHKVLNQTYRLSPSVYDFANSIMAQVPGREEAEYEPTDKYGHGAIVRAASPDLSLDGSHMILCRCQYQVKRWITWLTERGELWHNPYRDSDKYWNPTKTRDFEALKTYYKIIQDYATVSGPELASMVSLMKSDGNLLRGTKARSKDWAMARVEFTDLIDLGLTYPVIAGKKPINEIFRLKTAAAPIFESMVSWDLKSEPRVIVGTVHSVKGGEADHVWIDTAISPMIYRSVHATAASYNDEARVAYVAATRARQTVGLLNSRLRNPIL